MFSMQVLKAAQMHCLDKTSRHSLRSACMPTVATEANCRDVNKGILLDYNKTDERPLGGCIWRQWDKLCRLDSLDIHEAAPAADAASASVPALAGLLATLSTDLN